LKKAAFVVRDNNGAARLTLNVRSFTTEDDMPVSGANITSPAMAASAWMAMAAV
jgi:hypothetical protein